MKKKYLKPEALELDIDKFWKFINESTIQELADNLSNDSFLKIREISEIHNMWLLEKAINIFESFYRSWWAKSLWECVKESWIEGFQQILKICSWQSLIRLFSEFKEEYIDLMDWNDVEAFKEDSITLYKPSRWELNTKGIMKEIRDWICHRRYILWKDWIFIFNPKWKYHKRDFVASIKWDLFTDIYTIKKLSKSFRCFQFEHEKYTINDEDDAFLPYDEEERLSFEDLREIFAPMTENEDNKEILYETIQEDKDYLNQDIISKKWKRKPRDLSQITINESKKIWENNKYELSKDQQELLHEYYNEHVFTLSNFRTVFWHLENTRTHILDHLFINRIINSIKNIGEWYKNFRIFPKVINNKNDKDLYHFVNNSCLLLWEMVYWEVITYCTEILPTYLKMLYIINSYVNDTNIKMGLIREERDETRNIRDALAHWHYSLIPWVKQVLLYDPKSNYHKKIENIDEWYKERKEYEKTKGEKSKKHK